MEQKRNRARTPSTRPSRMATELPEDTSLKRRARRRLIGAIALVLLAVIVLPMIFDAEKKPLDQEVSIQIPAQGEYVAKPPQPGTVQPKGDAKAAPGADAPKGDASKGDAPATDPAKRDAPKGDAAASLPPVVPAVPPKSDPAKTEPPKTDAAKAEPPKVDAKAADAKALEAKAAEAKAAAKKAEDEKAARAKADAARAAALLNGGDTAPKSEKAAEKTATVAGNFVVQVGAFSTDEKVKEARDKLSAAGVKTYAEKVATKSGEVTRVRAGPYASRDAADAARGKIAGLGFGTAAVVSR